MKHLDIAFVILHYLVSEQTIKSIESINNCIDTKNYIIVVVDNNSDNGSLELLYKYSSNKKNIHIIKNIKNLGFANGNNAGINYVNENYDVDFICVLNNDVYLQSKNLYSIVSQEYSSSKFAVAGPKIYTKDGNCNSNPKEVERFTYKSVKHRQIEINVYYLLYVFHMEKIKDLLLKRKNNLNNEISKNTSDKQYNVQLHGCFYIFSKEYFKFFKGFDNRTFLYMEEEILFQHLINKQLISVFLPDIEVYHDEYGSTNTLLKNNARNKQLFILKHHKTSIKVLLDVMKEV